MPFLKLGEVGRSLSPTIGDVWSRAGILMEPDRYIRSRNYVAGTTGWALNADGTGELAGLTLSGDLYSSNWDGGFDLTSKDGTATAGYLLDYDSGSAQFMGDIFLGGDLLIDGGIANGTSGSYFEIVKSTGGGNALMNWYSGGTYEIAPAFIYTNAVATFTQLIMRGPRGGSGSNYGYGQIVLDGNASTPVLYLQAWGYGTADAKVDISPSSSAGSSFISLTSDYITVTGAVTISGQTQIQSGSFSAPALTFTSDPDTGMYLAGTNAVGFTAGGSKMFVITTQYAGSSNATGTPQMKVDAAGSATTPSYSFQSVTNAGMYWTGSGVAIAIGGTRQLFVDAGGMTIGDGGTTGQATFRDTGGSASAPVYTFIGDTNTGIYRAGADTMGFTCGGNLVASMNYTGGVKEFYIYGMTGTGTYNSVRVDTGTGKLYYLTSSRRFKTKITDAPYLSSVALRPRMFWQKNDKAWQYGLIAEEVAEVLPEAAVYQDEEVVNYDDRAVLAVLVAKINRLEEELAQLKSAM